MNNTLIIIVTYNAVRWIHKCLSSIDMVRYDVFVVDNASSDETCAIIRDEYPKVHSVKSVENLGFGRANNIGLRYAIEHDYNYVFLLNQDAWLLPDTIEKLILAQQQNPEYWILSPVQMHSDTNDVERVFAKYLRKNNIKHETDGLYEVDFVNAASWLIPIECVREVGGFDPLFPHYGEDNDYINRVHAVKKRVGVYMDVMVYHERNQKNESQEKANYRLGLGYLGVLKNNEHSFEYNTMYCLWCVLRKTAKGILKCDKSIIDLHWGIWKTVWARRAEIKRHRALSKQKGAFL